jgi:hypothetical protein
MTDITIPPESIEVVADQFARSEHNTHLRSLPEIVQLRLRNNARAACQAMLKAWPGMVERHYLFLTPEQPSAIFLPLTQERPND